MNENLLLIIVTLFAVVFHWRQRFDIFWIIPTVAAVFLSGKAQTICLLLAEAVILIRIFSLRTFGDGVSGTLTSQISTFALLSVAIVPVPASFMGPALMLYIYVRLLGFPFKSKINDQLELQTYDLFLPMLAWSLLGFQHQLPGAYIWASAFALISIFSILALESKRAYLSIFLAAQCFLGPAGPLTALIAALFLGRAFSQVLSSLMAFIFVVMLANSQDEAVAWTFVTIFSVVLGLARSGLKLPTLKDFSIKENGLSNIKDLTAVAIFVYYAHTIGIFEKIQSPLMSLALVVVLAEWLGRKYFPKTAWLMRNRGDRSLLSKLRDSWQRKATSLTSKRNIDYSFGSYQTKELPAWVEPEAVPIGLTILVVWGLWLWLY